MQLLHNHVLGVSRLTGVLAPPELTPSVASLLQPATSADIAIGHGVVEEGLMKSTLGLDLSLGSSFAGQTINIAVVKHENAHFELIDEFGASERYPNPDPVLNLVRRGTESSPNPVLLLNRFVIPCTALYA